MIHKIKNQIPNIHESCFIAWNAEVAGNVEIEQNVSVWFSATIRADIAPIKIGANTNIQDNSVIHIDTDVPCIIGKNVTIGHGAILHSSTVKEGSTIGMGAILLSNVVIGKNCIVGAGSLVTQGKVFPDNSLIVGSPAKVLRTLTKEEIELSHKRTASYVARAQSAKKDYVEIEPQNEH